MLVEEGRSHLQNPMVTQVNGPECTALFNACSPSLTVAPVLMQQQGLTGLSRKCPRSASEEAEMWHLGDINYRRAERAQSLQQVLTGWWARGSGETATKLHCLKTRPEPRGNITY